MQILLADETNTQAAADVRFLIYGGLVFDIDLLSELDNGIRRVRRTYGYKPSDTLKFQTRARPEHVSHVEATAAKRDVLALLAGLGCKFIAYMALHDIIKGTDSRLEYAVNSVLGRYQKYLEEVDDDGICVVDNLPIDAQWKFLSDKFTAGLEIHGKPDRVRLNRIKLYAATCLGASHANSALDIVLGTFRYCANEPKNREAAQDMMSLVSQIIWSKPGPGGRNVLDYGLIQRPKDVRVGNYKDEYADFITHVNSLLTDGRVSAPS